MICDLWTLPGTGPLSLQSRHPLGGQRIRYWSGTSNASSQSSLQSCKGSRASALHKTISCSACCTLSSRRPCGGSAEHQCSESGLSLDQQLLRGQRKRRRGLSRIHSSLQEEVLLPLGLDFLTFLAATVIVIPVFKSVKASPVLGFLFSGLILGQLG